jgi:hypothetical protein
LRSLSTRKAGSLCFTSSFSGSWPTPDSRDRQSMHCKRLAESCPLVSEPFVYRGCWDRRVRYTIGEKMLNPWLSIAFQATRLGWQTQIAVMDHLMRITNAGTSDRQEARPMETNKIDFPPAHIAADAHAFAEAPAVAPTRDGGAGEVAPKVLKVHKRRQRANRRRR